MGKTTKALLWIAISVLLGASACNPQEGGPCAKQGDTYTLDSKTIMKCVLEQGKLVWRQP